MALTRIAIIRIGAAVILAFALVMVGLAYLLGGLSSDARPERTFTGLIGIALVAGGALLVRTHDRSSAFVLSGVALFGVARGLAGQGGLAGTWMVWATVALAAALAWPRAKAQNGR